MTATKPMSYTLDSIDLVLCRAALRELASRYATPGVGEITEGAEKSITHGQELIEPYRGVTVIALSGYAMRHGPIAFAGVVSVSRKVGIEAALRASLKDWIEVSKAKASQG